LVFINFLQDALTPCENLIDNWFLQVAAWLISVFGIISNICAVIYNIKCLNVDYNKNNDFVSTFLLINLGIGDLMMNIYLLFIAYKDLKSRHVFDESAITWQNSFTCSLAGFLSVLACLSTALFLTFITFERFYAIKYSYYSKRIHIKIAFIIAFLIWFLSTIGAALPFFKINSYSSYAICLPFDTRTEKNKLYMVTMNILLVLCFTLISIFYLSILLNTVLLKKKCSMSSCNNIAQLKMRQAEVQKLLRNISVLVLVIKLRYFI
jgi:hypothetical protein